MILLDQRVGSKDFLDGIQTKVNCKVKLWVLNSGDVAWEGCGPDSSTVMVGLEIKTLGDMLTSMRSGRYIEQLNKMRGEYQYVYLLIQGSYAPDESGTLCTPTRGGWAPLVLQTKEQKDRGKFRARYSYNELDKFIASLEVKRDVIVRKACNKRDAIQQIVNLYGWWQKGFDAHDSVESVKTQEGIITGKASVLRRTAAQWPGIGWELAGKVDRHFKTVENAVNALPTEWKGITWKTKSGRNMRIGERTALEVYGSLRGLETTHEEG